MNPPVYEISVIFTALPTIPAKVDMTPEVMIEVLKTGLYMNQSVHSIVLDSFSTTEQLIVYNITAAKSGGQPWSLK